MGETIDKRHVAYMRGMCDAMAIALSRRTGLPLALICGQTAVPEDEWAYPGKPEFSIVPCHAVVVINAEEPVWLDVNGINRGLDQDFMFAEPVDRIVLQPASEEEVAAAFSALEGVTEAQIAEADSFIEQCEPLRQALTALPATAQSPALADLAGALIRRVQVLDGLLTGKPENDTKRTAMQQAYRFHDLTMLFSDAYYLSDGGYSRLVFKDDGGIHLASVSRREVAARWNDRPVEDARHAAELAYRALLGAYMGPGA